MFAPEKRYGIDRDPLQLTISGQFGSLAGDRGQTGKQVHLLDLKGASDITMDPERLYVNLTQIKHPAALPPVTMMNWLILIEERRAALHTAGP